jgi:hypothetical protein
VPRQRGGGLCNGSVPFSVTSLLGGGITVTASTEKFVITDNFGTFSFVFTLDPGLQNKTDNGSCQINGGAASFFNACTGANSNGTLFSLGHDLTGGGAFYSGVGNFLPTTITFTAIPGAFANCSSATPCNFDLGFVNAGHITRRSSRPHRRCRTARPDLGERRSSRLVAAATEDGLNFTPH